MAKNKVQRINTKGPLHGKCNICGNLGKLTEDHTPPKCCRGIRAAELVNLATRISAEKEPRDGARRFQAGVCFRTLCSRCNSLLGGEYDPALGQFADRVRTFALSGLALPRDVTFEVLPSAIMRSVLGHLAAQGVNRYLKGAITEPLRDYILDATAPLPQSIRFYYWFYPYRSQVLVRDAARMRLSNKAVYNLWIMKFFPLAFIVTFDEPPGREFDQENLDRFGGISPSSKQNINIRLHPVVHPKWPEAPDDDTLVLYGEQAHAADPLAAIVAVQ
jgi:hypothetical protein